MCTINAISGYEQSNGMLVKRPLLVLSDRVLVGFSDEAWEAALTE